LLIAKPPFDIWIRVKVSGQTTEKRNLKMLLLPNRIKRKVCRISMITRINIPRLAKSSCLPVDSASII